MDNQGKTLALLESTLWITRLQSRVENRAGALATLAHTSSISRPD